MEEAREGLASNQSIVDPEHLERSLETSSKGKASDGREPDYQSIGTVEHPVDEESKVVVVIPGLLKQGEAVMHPGC